MGGDPSIYFFGFNFFNRGEWQWPPGLIQSYNFPEMSSLVYTDSTPLISIVLKAMPFSDVYQFHGLFILSCFVLQGVSAFRLLYHYSSAWLSSIFGAMFFVLLPSFIFRGFPGMLHYSLLPHFLLIESIYYSFHPQKSRNLPIWTGLIVLALGFHFYLAFLVGVFFVVSQGREFKDYRPKAGYLWMLLAILAAAWIYGYFVIPVGSSAAWGFGQFSMNLNAPINPMGHSYFIKDFPAFDHQREGFQYLGLGLIILAVVHLRRDSWRRLTPPMQLGVLFVFLLSLSFSVSFFGWMMIEGYAIAAFFGIFLLFLSRHKMSWWKGVVLSATLVFFVYLAGHPLRSSGRFFWAIEYLMLFLIFLKKPRPAVLIFLLGLQCVDISSEFSMLAGRPINANASPPAVALPSIGESEYDQMALIGQLNTIPLELKAAFDRKKMGPLPTARTGGVRMNEASQQWRSEVLSLNLRPRVLYVVGDNDVWEAVQTNCGTNPSSCNAIRRGSEGCYRYLILNSP